MCVYRGISPASQVRTEVRMKSDSIWAKYREASEVVDLYGVISDYWSSNNHEFTVLSQSIITNQPHRADRTGQSLFSLESIVALWKCNSPQILLFVPFPPSIPAS